MYSVEFVDCDEGLDGDFDPADPKDVKLLRLDVSFGGEVVESYCTLVPASTDEVEKARLLAVAVSAMNSGKRTPKRLAELLSWMKPGFKEDDAHAIE